MDISFWSNHLFWTRTFPAPLQSTGPTRGPCPSSQWPLLHQWRSICHRGLYSFSQASIFGDCFLSSQEALERCSYNKVSTQKQQEMSVFLSPYIEPERRMMMAVTVRRMKMRKINRPPNNRSGMREIYCTLPQKQLTSAGSKVQGGVRWVGRWVGW